MADYQKEIAHETLDLALSRIEAMIQKDDITPCPASKEEIMEIIQLVKRAKKYISNGKK